MSFFKSESITKKYQNQDVIKNINVEINKNEIVSLLGVSGIGKTTLFNIMSGLEKPDSGKVELDGNDITGKTGMVSYMQQKDLLLPFRTILDNVSLPLILKGMDKKTAKLKAKEYFEEFGLDGCEKKYPSQLSGGMKQRASFLRAYLFSEKIMLLDEPFSALDSITKASLHEWYRNTCKKHHTTAFFITHDIDEAIFLSDRIYIMSGTPGMITNEIKIECNFERDTDFTLSDKFLYYKKLIKASI